MNNAVMTKTGMTVNGSYTVRGKDGAPDITIAWSAWYTARGWRIALDRNGHAWQDDVTLDGLDESLAYALPSRTHRTRVITKINLSLIVSEVR